ncbi:hypothetical protein POM88_047474 [Heracleum sosnowskyi]|uniref:Uncharacterized protein n=1 Tax=Heracleum sosnowskyi TaxID=360622 RepID=A0AAD8GTG8_9APIA|nr:hypothetical protein POM88_047474 [Heracleum sosnowskyi]
MRIEHCSQLQHINIHCKEKDLESGDTFTWSIQAKWKNHRAGKLIRGSAGNEPQPQGYVHVGTLQVSPNHNYLAYTLDITGAERFMLQVKNLNTGKFSYQFISFISGLSHRCKQLLKCCRPRLKLARTGTLHIANSFYLELFSLIELTAKNLAISKEASGNMTAAGSKLPFKLSYVTPDFPIFSSAAAQEGTELLR